MGWNGEHELRPTIPSDLDRRVDWEAQAAAFLHALQAHQRQAFWGVGTATTGWRHCAPGDLLRYMTLEIIRRTGSTASNPDAVDQLIQEVSDYVDSAWIIVPFLAPVLNFTMDRPEPLVFEDGIILRPLTDDEVTRLHGGQLGRQPPPAPFPFHGFAFSGEIREAKEPGTTSAKRNPAVSEDLKAKLDRLVLGLRTYKTGPVGCTAIHFLSNSLLPLFGSVVTLSFGNEYVPGGRIYEISDAEAEPLQQHMRLVAADLHPSLEAACGRLGAAQVRTEPRDKLIDAVIGLEAILLAETGDERYRGEMRFRFAMNYAVLHETPAECYNQFSIEKTFYDLRSALVHGEQVEECKFGHQILSLREAADRACEMLRFTIGRFLPGGRRPEYLNPDYWLRRYFPHVAGSDS